MGNGLQFGALMYLTGLWRLREAAANRALDLLVLQSSGLIIYFRKMLIFVDDGYALSPLCKPQTGSCVDITVSRVAYQLKFFLCPSWRSRVNWLSATEDAKMARPKWLAQQVDFQR